MPKIIDISKEKILNITNNILKSQGYKKLSVRKVAAESGIAVGTLYLYFSSKDDLVAQAIIVDWLDILAKMNQIARQESGFVTGVECFYQLVCDFMSSYKLAFDEYSKTVGSHNVLVSRHAMLREQISKHIQTLAINTDQNHLTGNTDMIAECILAVANQSDMDKNTLSDFIKLIIK